MILHQALTVEQRSRSQFNLHLFSFINGFSYMCTGETVVILLALRLHFSDAVSATLGAMLYVGFLLLPLGKTVAARVGGAKCQGNFWVARNLAALAIASSALWSYLGLRTLALIFLLGGSFLFYGFRAAGVVMSQPLAGEITNDSERPKFLAINSALFWVGCFFTLIVVSIVLYQFDSTLSLVIIISIGFILGLFASTFLRKVDETTVISESASKPILKDMLAALRDRSLQRLLFANFAFSVSIILVGPVSILMIKKGYGVSDAGALIYTLAQFGMSALAPLCLVRISNTKGPRKTLISAYLSLLAIPLFWLLCPTHASPTIIIPIFLLTFLASGYGRVVGENSVNHYFLQTVDPPKRVAASMMMSMVSSVFSGLFGICITSFLLNGLARGIEQPVPGDEMIHLYQHYFAIAFFILLMGLWLVLRVIPLPVEKRALKKPIWHRF